MANQIQIDQLRLVIGPGVLTDADLSSVIDTVGNDNLLEWAAMAWEVAAARYHSLVNISESGSSRQMGDLHKNALAMAASYRSRIASEVVEEIAGRSTTRKITRL